MQFNELNLSQEILQAVDELGFTEMTEIQEKSIPVLLQGRDVVGRSNTGTGKTAAFGIPAVESITNADKRTVAVLILCPTRELALQAYEEIRKFAKHKRSVKACAVYGGASMEKQIFELKRGANIVIGTPGRVMDHISRLYSQKLRQTDRPSSSLRQCLRRYLPLPRNSSTIPYTSRSRLRREQSLL